MRIIVPITLLNNLKGVSCQNIFTLCKGKIVKILYNVVCNAYVIWRFEVYAFNVQYCVYIHIYNRFEKETCYIYVSTLFYNDLMLYWAKYGIEYEMGFVFLEDLRDLDTSKWTIHSRHYRQLKVQLTICLHELSS